MHYPRGVRSLASSSGRQGGDLRHLDIHSLKLLMALGEFLETGIFPEGAVRKVASVVLRHCVRLRPWSWWRRPVEFPGVRNKPSYRWGRLLQAFQLSSKDAESIG
jgi:hypothetical protein